MNHLFPELTILTYHKITHRREAGINTVTPDQFHKQMKFLYTHGYNTVTFQDLKKSSLPPQPVILTFDDGYASVYENAISILNEFGFKAVIFLITDYLGKENTWDANLGGLRFRHLNEKQVKHLSLNGMELGSHGTSHRALSYLKEQEVERELTKSRERISQISHHEVTTLAYPFGIQNRKIQKIAVQCGYQFGCINLWGKNRMNNPMSLKRIPVYRTDSISAFQKKLNSGNSITPEKIKLMMLSWPALLTPLYQKYIKKLY